MVLVFACENIASRRILLAPTRNHMLKRKLTSAAYAALDAALQALYKKAEGSDSYLLDAEDDDGAELKTAKDREKKRADKAEADAKALADKVQALEDEKDELANKGKDGLDAAGVAKLKAQHATALAAEKKLRDDMTNSINDALTTEAATRIAADISTVPELLAPIIKARLRVELEEGKPVVRVLDADGNVTANKIEDFQKEVVANPKFAPIIQASKASGGGASGSGKGGGAAGKKLSEMTALEEATYANSHPVEYAARLASEAP